MSEKFWRVIDRDHYVAEACLVDADDAHGGKYRTSPPWLSAGTLSAEYTTDKNDAFPFSSPKVARCVAKALRAAEQEEGENAEHRVVAVTVTKKSKKTISGWPQS